MNKRVLVHALVWPLLVPALVGAFFLSGAACGIYTQICSSDHTVRVAFDRANQLVWGQEVRLAGRKVGEVKSVETQDGHAVLTLKINDPQAWPLRRGTVARARFGSTTSYTWRYIELEPGPYKAPPVPNGGVLSRADSSTPFEYDDAFRLFRGRTKQDFRAFVDGLGATVGDRGRAIGDALHDAPGGLEETAAFVHELGVDDVALRTLIESGDDTTSALATRDAELRDLVTRAAGTFDTFARHADDQRLAIERLPRAFDTSTGTLHRLDGTLVRLDALVGDLRPGARELRALAPPARGALAELRAVAPLAADALREGSRAAPPLTRLLDVGTSVVPRLGTDLRQLQPMVGCLRPYGPEIAGTLGAWTGFGMNYDEYGHYIHGFPLQSNRFLQPGGKMNSQQIVAASNGTIFYAMPRPPGLNASQGIGHGRPYFQPQCGAGPEALDPSKDPEGAGRHR